MAKAYCLLNHDLTENQKNELFGKFYVSQVIYPDEELKSNWAQVPATESFDRKIIAQIINWLSAAKESDCLIIQGEFGSTFLIVDYALKNKLIPLHAVTKRCSVEEKNGESIIKKIEFQHVCFRKYMNYEDFSRSAV